MPRSTPATLYCTLVGALLVVIGLIGFLYSASFHTGAGKVAANAEDMLGIFAVNGWSNLIDIALGLTALAVARSATASRVYALGVGLLLVVVSIWGFAAADDVIAGMIPANAADNLLYLLLGLIALGAGAAAPTVARKPRPARTASSASA